MTRPVLWDISMSALRITESPPKRASDSLLFDLALI